MFRLVGQLKAQQNNVKSKKKSHFCGWSNRFSGERWAHCDCDKLWLFACIISSIERRFIWKKLFFFIRGDGMRLSKCATKHNNYDKCISDSIRFNSEQRQIDAKQRTETLWIFIKTILNRLINAWSKIFAVFLPRDTMRKSRSLNVGFRLIDWYFCNSFSFDFLTQQIFHF